MTPSVRDSIRRYVVETLLEGDERGLTDATDLQKTGLLDSFAATELVAFLEETFGVRLEPTDVNAENFQSVASLAALVDRLR